MKFDTAGCYCRTAAMSLQEETDERDNSEQEAESCEEVQPRDGVDTCEEYGNNEVTRVREEGDHLLPGHLPNVLSRAGARHQA